MNIIFGCATLRAIEPEDAEQLMNMMNDPEIDSRTVGMHLPVSRLSQAEWASSFRNSEKQIRLMIQLDNGTCLGMASLTDIDWINRCATCGIKIGHIEGDRVRGDVKDAFYALLSLAFLHLNLNRVEGGTIDNNYFSLKLTKSLGFKDEGIQRKRVYRNGEWHDIIMKGILREDFIIYEDGEAPWQKNR